MTAVDVPERTESLRAFVPATHLHWLDHHPEARWRELHGSLLYADVSGFTAMSERLSRLGKRGAEETNELINGLMGGMVADCAAEGGEVLVFAGDAVIALFEGEQHTARAARAAHAIRATVTRRHSTSSGVTAMLRVSSGVHSGELLLARTTPGFEKLVVLGPAVSALCAAEAAATAGEIALTDGAASLLDERYVAPADGRGFPMVRRKPPAVPGAATMRHDGSGLHAHALVPHDRHELLALARPGEHRQVTLAFVEFSGVDDLLDREGPEAVVAALDELSLAVAREAGVHRVHVLDTDIAVDGGRYYLASGAPTSTESDEECLLRAALAVVGHAGPFRLRAGLNRGRVFAGVIGGPTRRAYTCLGDAVNLAARLCARAPSGQVLVTMELLDHVRASTETHPLPPITVKGKTIPIETALVLGIARRDADATSRTSTTADDPLVGRGAELAQLVELAHRAVAGRGASVVVSGEAGIGKSRLLAEVASRSGIRCVWSDSEPYLVTTPYATARRVLRPLLGIANDADDDAVAARLAELADLAEGVHGLLPLAGRAVGVALPPTREVDELTPSFVTATLHRVVFSLLDAARVGSVMIVVDDAYWADEASFALFEAMAERARGQGWLLCIGMRDDEWAPADAVRIRLGPLPAADAEELTRILLADSVSARERRVVDERGAGNPLFLHELTRAARASGSVSDLPESIESLLMARIDLLAAADRSLLREAAVLGRRVDASFLARVLDDPGVDDAHRWERLSAFVEAVAPSTYRFVHTLTQEAAYEGLPFGRRRALHAKVGEELEAEEQAVERHAAMMALHFAAAGDHERGWRYGVVAGDQAMLAYANADAAAAYERALQEVPFLTLDRAAVAAVEERYGDVCDLAGRYDEAARAYRRARRRAPSARLLRKIGFIHERIGEYDKAHRAQARALRELHASTSRDTVAERALVHAFSAGLHYRQGRLHAALEAGIRAAVDAQSANDPQVLAKATLLLELVTSQLGFVGKSVELFQSAGDLNGEADARNNRGIVAYYRGDWTTALAEYEKSSQLYARTGDVVGAATAHNNIGEILSDQGRYDDALDHFADAERGFRDANYPVGLALVIANIGRTAARCGDTARGLDLLDDALRRFRELDAGAFVLELQCRRLECLLLAGALAEAGEVDVALAAATSSGGPDAQTLAVLHRLRGWLALEEERFDDAATHLATSRDEAAIADARYERALTLLVTGTLEERSGCPPSDASAEAWAMLDELDVVNVAGWPRPTAARS